MSRSSPYSEGIYPEWERLVTAETRTLADNRTPHPDQVAGWRALYKKAFDGERWRVSAADAGLVASLGVTIALQERRFDDAAVRAQEYLKHPNAADGDHIIWEHLSIRHGLALILGGRIQEGVSVLDGVLNDSKRERPGRRPGLRGELIQASPDLGEETMPDPRLLKFVHRLLSGWQEQAAKADVALTVKTHGGLIETLQSTYPLREP